MNAKTVSAVTVGVVIALAAGLYFFAGKTEAPAANTTSSQSQTNNTATDTPATKTYTLAEVAAHNTATDCWTIISGSVYDITAYVPRHPGGSEIEAACGTDGTTLFTQRRTASGETVGSGTPHSSQAASQLADYKIGTLAN